jgi:hypothetical protein
MLDYMIDFVANIDLSLRYFVALSQNASINAGEYMTAFFTNSVTLAGWFVSNAGSLFVNLYNHSGRIFGNMIDMMKGLWDGLWSYIKGDGFTVDFMPMIDSFNAAVDGIKLPELQTPQLDQLRGQLDSIEGEFLARQIARSLKGKKQTEETGETAIAALDIQEDTEKGITDEKQKQKELSTSFVSLAGLANKMQEQRKFTGAGGGGGAQAMQQMRPAGEMANNIGGRDQINAMQQQLTTMQALLELARGAGIRVAQQAGGVALPNASVQFGATGS